MSLFGSRLAKEVDLISGKSRKGIRAGEEDEFISEFFLGAVGCALRVDKDARGGI